MTILDARRVYNTLQNLTNLEISYMEYSQSPHDFSEYQTYIGYFNNYVIRSKELYRFYFPAPPYNIKLPKYVSDIGDVTDVMNIMSGFDFSVSKLFNFPGALRHKCNYYSLIYQMEGTGALTLDCGHFALQAGDFYLIPPEIYYALETSLDGLCICFNLRRSFVAAEYQTISLENPQLTRFLTDSLAGDSSIQYAAVHTDANDTINNLVLSIFAEYINGDEYSSITMRSYLPLLFATILRNPNTRLESSARVSRQDEQYHQIEAYLKKNYQTANLTEISDALHFSKQYICRIVKEKTGETFNALLMRIRLQMVIHHLLDTNLPLEEIAYLCGFSTASHMSRTFKNEYGVSPSVYRNKQKTLPTP